MQITVQSVINNFSKVTAEISKKILLHVSLIVMTNIFGPDFICNS